MLKPICKPPTTSNPIQLFTLAKSDSHSRPKVDQIDDIKNIKKNYEIEMTDVNGRNMLHRLALSQNYDNLVSLFDHIEQYQSISDFIDRQDRYGKFEKI